MRSTLALLLAGVVGIGLIYGSRAFVIALGVYWVFIAGAGWGAYMAGRDYNDR